jgi:tetratricopeptide (TPR) repeat protein
MTLTIPIPSATHAAGLFICATLSVFLLLLHPLAHAQTPNRVEEAKQHNATAEKYFSLGKFHEAATEYEKAYQAMALPEFLFNLGQCYRRLDTLRDKEKAVFYFESYLTHAPHADDRAEAEENITQLRQEIAQMKQERAQRERAITSAPTVPPSPREAKPFYQRWWFWTVVGGVIATAATTSILIASQPADPVRGTLDPGQVQLELRP